MKSIIAVVFAGALLALGGMALMRSGPLPSGERTTRDVVLSEGQGEKKTQSAQSTDSAATTTGNPEAVASGPSDYARRVHAPVAHSRNSDRMVTESMLLMGNDLDSNAAGSLLRAEDGFEKALDRMTDEMQSDADALALSETYAQAIGAQLSPGSRQLQLDRLACGLRLCAASFDDAADEAAWNAWRQRFDGDLETPHRVFVERTLVRPDGSVQRRVIFTTDPTSQGVDVRGG